MASSQEYRVSVVEEDENIYGRDMSQLLIPTFLLIGKASILMKQKGISWKISQRRGKNVGCTVSTVSHVLEKGRKDLKELNPQQYVSSMPFPRSGTAATIQCSI